MHGQTNEKQGSPTFYNLKILEYNKVSYKAYLHNTEDIYGGKQ